jgi:chromosomal replication initiation ATPase DnaA
MGDKRNINQLVLDVRHRLAYRPDNFVLHSGVSGILNMCIARLCRPGFELIFIEGGLRSGKTHFCIRLAEELSAKALIPRLLDGRQLREWLSDKWPVETGSGSEVYLIDDAQEYLSTLSPENGGSFVNFVEALRACQGRLVLLSSTAVGQFPWDEHVYTRVNSGTQFCFGAPSDDEVGALVEGMAKQRGIRLSDRKLHFLLKRVGRDIAAIERYLSRVEHLSGATGGGIDLSLLGDALE